MYETFTCRVTAAWDCREHMRSLVLIERKFWRTGSLIYISTRHKWDQRRIIQAHPVDEHQKKVKITWWKTGDWTLRCSLKDAAEHPRVPVSPCQMWGWKRSWCWKAARGFEGAHGCPPKEAVPAGSRSDTDPLDLGWTWCSAASLLRMAYWHC